MTASFRKWVQRFALAAFFVLVFGVEWLLVFSLASLIPPIVALLIGSWLPNVIGVFITAVAGGRPGLRELASKVVLWRIPVGWYAVAFLLPPVLTFLAIGLYSIFSAIGVQFAATDQLATIIVVCLFTGALGEELGWRGTALPRLQARWNPLIASLVLGILWGLYHLPSFLVRGLPLEEVPLVPFMLGALGLTILVSWTFNHTRGSLIPVFLYHFAFNVMLNVTGMLGNAKLFWLLGSVCMLAAAAVIIMDWSTFVRPPTTSNDDGWAIRDR